MQKVVKLVGWVKADTKAIQAIHEQVITHNPRVSVSHSDLNTWNLHIKSVTEEDRGGYMCQLNTDPMKSQIGFLDVVIPPDFISEDTSSDVIVPEGSSVKLTCRARGYPEPIVTWRREDNEEIILKDSQGAKQHVTSFRGEILKLTKLSRGEMGAYLCIASNGVPPSVSKRISLSIHCEMIVSSGKYHVQENTKSIYETRMSVTVRNFKKEDVGSYRCIAKNSLGEVDSSIRLYEIPGPTRKVFAPKYGTETNDVLKIRHPSPKVTYQPEEDDLYGSAEDFDDPELTQNGAGVPGIFIKPTRAAGQDVYTRHVVPMVGLVTRSPYLIPAIRGGQDSDANFSSRSNRIHQDRSARMLVGFLVFHLVIVTSYLPS
uniref:Putative lachesin n=1 Tax=Lutzomyia longipalpis TaxID=7200 RepID=A0A1B0CRC5_LUTLO